MTQTPLMRIGRLGSGEVSNTSGMSKRKWTLRQNSRRRIEGINIPRERDEQTNRTLGESPAGPKTRGGEKTVGRGQVGELQEEEMTLRQTHQGAIRETAEIALDSRGEPTLVVPHLQVVGHHQEEIRRPRNPSTTRATLGVRVAMSRT